MNINGDPNIPTIMPTGQADAISGYKLSGDKLALKNKGSDDKEAIGELASKFESILWKKFLDDATKPVFETDVTKDSTRSSIYRDMMNHALATSVTEMSQGHQSVSSALAAQLYIEKDRTDTPQPVIQNENGSSHTRN